MFIPANGAVVDAPHLQPPSPLPAAMDPMQAAAAAEILVAQYAVPMHYEAEQPDKVAGYVEVSDPKNEFRAHAGRRVHVSPRRRMAGSSARWLMPKNSGSESRAAQRKPPSFERTMQGKIGQTWQVAPSQAGRAPPGTPAARADHLDRHGLPDNQHQLAAQNR
ncbi:MULTISPECIES: hypothetical protein [unclassified Amycolatopsis]|uniref:hypothetical protein n=1 Tax=unclassified Amycolatopsis TaxID=2618356 RepID=UPI001F0FBD2A|nr:MULTISPECIES: hypothetical protein [unclassified Amycolatopsis]